MRCGGISTLSNGIHSLCNLSLAPKVRRRISWFGFGFVYKCQCLANNSGPNWLRRVVKSPSQSLINHTSHSTFIPFFFFTPAGSRPKQTNRQKAVQGHQPKLSWLQSSDSNNWRSATPCWLYDWSNSTRVSRPKGAGKALQWRGEPEIEPSFDSYSSLLVSFSDWSTKLKWHALSGFRILQISSSLPTHRVTCICTMRNCLARQPLLYTSRSSAATVTVFSPVNQNRPATRSTSGRSASIVQQ